jgi:hypothetical protein
MIADSRAAVRFLQIAFDPTDWVALLLKSYATGDVLQRIGPVSRFMQPSIHRWLRAMNARSYNVYVTVNALATNARDRTKGSVAHIRHVFLEADANGAGILASIHAANDLPTPSYVLTSSLDHVHVFWRAVGHEIAAIERLQKHLATRLGTDVAATACSQTTRVPGYRNRKYDPAPLVTSEYWNTLHRFKPEAFPAPPAVVESERPVNSGPSAATERVPSTASAGISPTSNRRSPAPMATCIRSASAAESSAVSILRTRKRWTCCANGTDAASRRGPTASSKPRSQTPHATAASHEERSCSRASGTSLLNQGVSEVKGVRLVVMSAPLTSPIAPADLRRVHGAFSPSCQGT